VVACDGIKERTGILVHKRALVRCSACRIGMSLVHQRLSQIAHITHHHPSHQRQRLLALQHARGDALLSSAFPQQDIVTIICCRHFRSIA
jgi:hypothetical protein